LNACQPSRDTVNPFSSATSNAGSSKLSQRTLSNLLTEGQLAGNDPSSIPKLPRRQHFHVQGAPSSSQGSREGDKSGKSPRRRTMQKSTSRRDPSAKPDGILTEGQLAGISSLSSASASSALPQPPPDKPSVMLTERLLPADSPPWEARSL
jgi:hypothetical protein